MVYERITALIPKKISEKFESELMYVGIEIPSKKLLGFFILFGFFLSLGITMHLYLFLAFPVLISFPILYLIFFAVIYVWLANTSESKGKFVESILPDALQLISSNLKAGLTPERALLVSARPEFGPFQLELKRASKLVMAGEKIEIALAEISLRIKSIELSRTLWLLSEGIKSGGQLSDLLVELSDNLREQQATKAEISADISIYVLLIFFTAAIGAPILFGISSFIAEVLSARMNSFASIDLSGAAMSGKAGMVSNMISGASALSTEFLLTFTIISLIITSIFSSLTIGVINSGKESNGAKFIPLILLISFALFFAIRWIMAQFFGQLL
ncbi:MAG: type II secretion system F family protein [Candidatus Diapherotrites archaeon]|nr:type II secretion system F family protein [Candidatus Diapherotrites archaeon]